MANGDDLPAPQTLQPSAAAPDATNQAIAGGGAEPQQGLWSRIVNYGPGTPAGGSMEAPDQEHHTMLQAVVHGLSGLLPGVAAERRELYAKKAHQAQIAPWTISSCAITQAQKGNPDILEDKSVQKAFNAMYGDAAKPTLSALQMMATHIAGHYDVWNKAFAAHNQDPLATYDYLAQQNLLQTTAIPKEMTPVIQELLKRRGAPGAAQAGYQDWYASVQQHGGDQIAAWKDREQNHPTMPVPPDVAKQMTGLETKPAELAVTEPFKVKEAYDKAMAVGAAQTEVLFNREVDLRGVKADSAQARAIAVGLVHEQFQKNAELRRAQADYQKMLEQEAARARAAGQKFVPKNLLKDVVIFNAKGEQVYDGSKPLQVDQLEQMTADPGYTFVTQTWAQKLGLTHVTPPKSEGRKPAAGGRGQPPAPATSSTPAQPPPVTLTPQQKAQQWYTTP